MGGGGVGIGAPGCEGDGVRGLDKGGGRRPCLRGNGRDVGIVLGRESAGKDVRILWWGRRLEVYCCRGDGSLGWRVGNFN